MASILSRPKCVSAILMNDFTHVHKYHKWSYLVVKRLNTTTCDLHGDLSMQSTATEAWPNKPCKLKVINPSCLHIDCILPKGPYLPCVSIGPFWQDTLDIICITCSGIFSCTFLFVLLILMHKHITLTTWGPEQDKQKEQQHLAMHSLNTLGRDKMDDISQTTFSNAFSWMKMFEYRLKFHGNLFLRTQSTIFQHLVQIMAWRRPGDKPLSEPMMVSLPTHVCVTRPQWVKRSIIPALWCKWVKEQWGHFEEFLQERLNRIEGTVGIFGHFLEYHIYTWLFGVGLC